MRKFAADESGFTWSHGNFVVKSPIHANISKIDTIECACKKFRKSIKLLQPEGSFYTTKHVLNFINTPPASIFGCLSSIGPIEYKRPIVDIDIENCWLSKEGIGDHGENFGSQFTIVSYSKKSEYRNDFCYFTRFPPASMSFENGKMLSESFNHFLRNVSHSIKFDDALNELISFQNSLKKLYKYKILLLSK